MCSITLGYNICIRSPLGLWSWFHGALAVRVMSTIVYVYVIMYVPITFISNL